VAPSACYRVFVSMDQISSGKSAIPVDEKRDAGMRAEWQRPGNVHLLSPAFDMYFGHHYGSPAEGIPLLQQAIQELAALDPNHDLREEAFEEFRAEQHREPGDPPEYLQKMVEKGYRPSINDMASIHNNDLHGIAVKMADKVRERCDPRTGLQYANRFYDELNGRIRTYYDQRELDAEGGESGDRWTWRGPKGAWREVRVKDTLGFDPASLAEREKEREEETQLWDDVHAFWKGKEVEGILRDHPQYNVLFKKYAKRYLRDSGSSKEEAEETLELDRYSLRNAVARGRDWIDESIREELQVMEGFIDITNDPDRQEELGIFPQSEY